MPVCFVAIGPGRSLRMANHCMARPSAIAPQLPTTPRHGPGVINEPWFDPW